MPYVAGGGAAASLVGGKISSGAAQDTALAQAGEAGSERNFNVATATPTPDEIQALQNQLTNYNQTANLQGAQLQQQMQLYGTVSPQVQSLLQGGMAPTLQPYLNVQSNQRMQLQSDLARQLGPGWQNTTAGNQAMQNFNLQGSNQAAQIQQQYLGTMMANQLALGASNTGAINQNAQTLGGLNMGMIGAGTDLQKMMLQASMGSNISNYMGAGNLQQQMMGNMLGQMGGAAMGIGGSMLGAQSFGNALGGSMGGGGGSLGSASTSGIDYYGGNPYGATP